jgi:hypothetical protein
MRQVFYLRTDQARRLVMNVQDQLDAWKRKQINDAGFIPTVFNGKIIAVRQK